MSEFALVLGNALECQFRLSWNHLALGSVGGRAAAACRHLVHSGGQSPPSAVGLGCGRRCGEAMVSTRAPRSRPVHKSSVDAGDGLGCSAEVWWCAGRRPGRVHTEPREREREREGEREPGCWELTSSSPFSVVSPKSR